jgi:hypothetical protein
MERKQQILLALDDTLSRGRQFDQNPSEGVLNAVSARLVSLEGHLREEIQSDTSNKITEIIAKLYDDKPISESEIQLIRIWILSDAEFYTQMENDYPGWLQELTRLLSVLGQLRGQTLSLEVMAKISGTARDAIRVIGDITFFMTQKERINRYESASRDLTSNNKVILADILTRKLNSEKE